jgi:hypothetical protein
MEYREYWEDLDLPPKEFSIEEFLQQEQRSEQERLEKELERIESLLEERREINSETVKELESKLDWYVETLEDLYHSFGAVDEDKKRELKGKIEEFYSELRREKRNQWRDKIELEMELREVERSLEELEDEELLRQCF